MIKTAGRATPILNYICVILLFAIFVLQLTPFWTNADKVETSPVNEVRVTSIQNVVWFPANEINQHTPATDMVKYFEDKYSVKGDKWEVADIATMPAIIVVCCIITFFFGIKKPTRLWMNIVYLLAGGLALITYLTQPIFQLSNQWTIHAAVSGALVLASIANIAFRPWKKIMHYLKTGE